MRHIRPIVALALLVGMLTMGAACGTGGSSGDDSIGDCPPPFTDNLTGTWVVDQVWFANDCTFVGPSQGVITVTQNDNQLTIFGQGVTTATLCGSRAESNNSYSYLINGGTMTVSRFLVQFQNQNQASGNTTWVWRNNQGAETCSGTSTLTLQR